MTGGWEERSRLSEAAYLRDPDRGAGEPSAFARWVLERLKRVPGGRELIEVGCGTGRDASLWALEGFRVRAVDFSPTAIERALERKRTLREPFRSRVTFVEGEAIQFVEGRPPGSADAVLSHLVYNTWSERELHSALDAVRRVLRPSGLHLYAVRDTGDPTMGKGTLVAPRTYLGGPHVVPYRYFALEDIERLTRPRFERVETLHSPDSHLYFVADRRAGVPSPPTASSTPPGG